MSKTSVKISVDPGLVTRYYRNKVNTLGREQAIVQTMKEGQIRYDDACALLDGQKEIAYINNNYQLVDAAPFWTPDKDFADLQIRNQADVDNWFARAEQFYNTLCDSFDEKDRDVLRCKEIQVSKFLQAFQHVRDQFLDLPYHCQELVPGLRYSKIVGRNPERKHAAYEESKHG